MLYFDNLSPDTADAYLADGLTEEITLRLGQIERLAVTSRTAVRRYRGRPAQDPRALGRALGVTYLVSGSVRRAGMRLRVAIELVRASTGLHVWGDGFDRVDGDLLAIERDVAAAVATAIAGRLLTKEHARLNARPTRDPVAYDRFLRGHYYVAQRTPRALERAIDEYDAATRADPQFAEAQARKAYAYAQILYYGWPHRGLAPESLLALGLNSANEALRTDSSSAEAWWARGRMLEFLEPRTYAGVREAYERAVILDPRNPDVLHTLGATLRELDDDSGAARAFHRALALDPHRPATLTLLGIQAFLAGRYREAVRWTDSALTVDPGFRDAYASRGFYRLYLGDAVGARADAETALRLQSGDRLFEETLLVAVDASEGDTSAARNRAERLVSETDLEQLSPLRGSFVAQALIAIAEYDRALEVLERVRPRGPAFWFWLRPVGFEVVRSHPRFQRLVEDSRPPGAPR